MPIKARPKTGKKFENLRATDTLADHHRAIRINTVNLKHRLRNIETNCANLAHGRLPSMWFVSTKPPYGTRCRRVGAVHSIIRDALAMSARCPFYPDSDRIADIPEWQKSAK